MEVRFVAVATADRRYLSERTDIGAVIKQGAVWGVIAAAVMAMYAMVAGATYLNAGFFTPLYHIASSVIPPDTMMTSMKSSMENQNIFHFVLGPAMVGMMIHLTTGAIFGIVFALIARAARLSGVVTMAIGAAFGIAAMFFSSFVGLPAAAALFGGGDPIADMPKVVGWTTFTIEHVIFGMVLGLGWLVAQRRWAASEREVRS
ncbi:MAG: hypothetical protein ACR2L3_05895 [Actinomycetota bacterium]